MLKCCVRLVKNPGNAAVVQIADQKLRRLSLSLSLASSPDIQALLLSDCLLLLQRGPDDRLLLRNPSRWMGGGGGVSGDSKTSLSPVVKLDSLLVRQVATSTAKCSRLQNVLLSLLCGSNVSKKKTVCCFQTTTPSISLAPRRGRCTSWLLVRRQRKTRKNHCYYTAITLLLHSYYTAITHHEGTFTLADLALVPYGLWSFTRARYTLVSIPFEYLLR